MKASERIYSVIHSVIREFTQRILLQCVLATAFGLSTGITVRAADVECPEPPAGLAQVHTPMGGFAIDGDLQADSTQGDWLEGPSPSAGFVLDNEGNPMDNSRTFHLEDLYNGYPEDGFAGGEKAYNDPTTWRWTIGQVNKKTDINHALMHVAENDLGTWLVVSADRFSNEGSAYIDFEFLQGALQLTTDPDDPNQGGFQSAGTDGGRTANDFVLTISFENGGDLPRICFWRWVNTGSEAAPVWEYVSVQTDGDVLAAVNSAALTTPYQVFGGSQYEPNTFAEVAVNLTRLVAGFDPCLTVGIETVLIKTKQSPSPDASISDFIAPLQIDLVIGPSVNAGEDLSACSQGAETTFSLEAIAQAGSHPLDPTKTQWTVVDGTASIASPNSLGTDVTLMSESAVLEITIEDTLGCTKSDLIQLTVIPTAPCVIDGPESLYAGQQDAIFTGPPGQATYTWTVAYGDGAPAEIAPADPSTPHVLSLDVANVIGPISIGLTTISDEDCETSCSVDYDIGVPPSGCIGDVPSHCPYTEQLFSLGIGYPGESTVLWTVDAGDSLGAAIVGDATGNSVLVQAGSCGTYTVQVTITLPDQSTQTCVSYGIVQDNELPVIVAPSSPSVSVGADCTGTVADLGVPTARGGYGGDVDGRGRLWQLGYGHADGHRQRRASDRRL
jgi:hypothetical protein